MDIDLYKFDQMLIKGPEEETLAYLEGFEPKAAFVVPMSDAEIPEELKDALVEAGCGPDDRVFIVVQ